LPISTKQDWNNLEAAPLGLEEGFASMTPRDMKFYRKGFESAFKLMCEYVENGVDLQTARENAEKIMSIENNSRAVPKVRP
jgi:predicted acetyltransferase